MNPIISILQQLGPLSDELVSQLESIIEMKTVSANTHLLEIGNRARSMFFLQKGLARVYYLHDEKDVTDYFAIDGQFIGAVPSLLTGEPSKKGIHLIETSEVWEFSYAAYEALCARYHELEHVSRLLIQRALIEEQDRIEKLRFYSMRERYDFLEKKYPGIMNRCPLHYIASYLGTTQVSISRIRSGIQ